MSLYVLRHWIRRQIRTAWVLGICLSPFVVAFLLWIDANPKTWQMHQTNMSQELADIRDGLRLRYLEEPAYLIVKVEKWN